VCNPWCITLDLTCLHVMHLSQIFYKSLFMLGQEKCSCQTSKVLAIPKCRFPYKQFT
jgi:hypothetical protein